MKSSSDLLQRYRAQKKRQAVVDTQVSLRTTALNQARQRLESILREQKLLENSLEALKKVKPILSASSIEQCEKLANIALKTIFGTDATLKYSAEDSKFVIDEGDYETDLKEGNGGGYLAVISLIFNIFLLLKMRNRLFLCFDEHFTQISEEYFYNFFEFLHKLTQELGADILLITHDKRIEEHMVDHMYRIEDGTALKSK